jgi:RNA polymerase sigma factor (sigma-70 family)
MDRVPYRGRLSAQCELKLVVAAKRGGERERQELIDRFMPSIAGVARTYGRSRAVGWVELKQEGVVGLLRALERFDPELGVPFWAYASWWVRQAMQEVVSELSRPLVLSDRALRQLARIKAAQRSFEQARRGEPTCGELAELAGLSRPKVEQLISTDRVPRCLSEPAGAAAGEDTTLADSLADPHAEEPYEAVPYRELAAHLPRMLSELSDRERTVVCSRYGIGRRRQTLREAAGTLGVTPERVRQIEQQSLEKLHSVAERASA